MKALQSILVMSIFLLIAGCTTDHPSKGGLFGGLVGLGSGTYERRVVDETAALKAEKERYRSETESKAALDRSLRGRRTRADHLEVQVASLRKDVDGLEGEIASLQQEEVLTGDKVEQVEADVASLLEKIDRIEKETEAYEGAEAPVAEADQDEDPTATDELPREQVSDLRAYITKLQKAVDGLKSAREQNVDEGVAGQKNKPE